MLDFLKGVGEIYIVNLLELLLEIRYIDIANYGYNEVNSFVFKILL